MMPGTTHIPFDRGRMTGSSRPGRKTSAAPPTGGPIMPNKANLRGRDARDWRLGIRGGRHGACRSGECQTNPISCVSASRTSMEMKTKPICRTRRARLGIADWGLGIQRSERAEWRSAKCQTKPISGVSGPRIRVGRKNKANLPRFWLKNEGRDENKANLPGPRLLRRFASRKGGGGRAIVELRLALPRRIGPVPGICGKIVQIPRTFSRRDYTIW